MRVFVTRQLPDCAIDRIQGYAEAEVWPEDGPPPREIMLEKVSGIDGLLCLLTDRIDGELLDMAPGLRVVSQMAVGFDNVDIEACSARGVKVGNTPGVLTETTADLAFTLLLATARRITEGERFLREGRWTTWSPMLLAGQDAHHATLGIIGMGRIGYEMARRAIGFQMEVLYTDDRPNPAAEADFGARRVDLGSLLAASDFVSVHTPLTPATRALIGAAELARMKATAILVNSSRGPVVDQRALAEALRTGAIAGAGIDVFEAEPVPLDDPLLSLDNVVLVPHIGSASVATRTRMAMIAADNLIAGLEGHPLPCPVN